ncbi:MAG: DUF2442 domain-containing protein [Bacteroidetes bacterium]|nr:DUF2442 domain-containing protein [Bacteroidota bacterium]
MTSLSNGTNISEADVTNISSLGLWVMVDDKEYFVPFSHYPAFINASISDIFDIKLLSPNQLFWESLDIDIELDALMNPNLFPLVYKG